MLEIIIGSFIGCLLCVICVIGGLLFVYDKAKNKNKLKGVKPPSLKRKEKVKK